MSHTAADEAAASGCIPAESAWFRVLRNPKYSEWVAKAVVFCLYQWEHHPTRKPPC